jgi:PD-(D/E)XK nuclease superfamily
MLVEDPVMLELEANRALAPANEVQLVNYLTATGVENGLLLNFGAERLGFKRKTRTYRPKSLPKDFILSHAFARYSEVARVGAQAGS